MKIYYVYYFVTDQVGAQKVTNYNQVLHAEEESKLVEVNKS